MKFANRCVNEEQPQKPQESGEIDGNRVVILEIHAAVHQPVQFNGEEFIRMAAALQAGRGLNMGS